MENEIKIPTITIRGKTITPKSPKMKAWRKYLEFFDQSNEEIKAMTLAEYTNSMIDLIQLAFNRDEVTAESIEENVEVAELQNLLRQSFTWLQKVFFAGVEEIPKNATEAEEI